MGMTSLAGFDGGFSAFVALHAMAGPARHALLEVNIWEHPQIVLTPE
jgi:hypothetical protein